MVSYHLILKQHVGWVGNNQTMEPTHYILIIYVWKLTLYIYVITMTIICFIPQTWEFFMMQIYFKMYSFIYSQQGLITIIIIIIQLTCICAWNEVESISNIVLVQLLQRVRLSQYSDIVYLQESSTLCRTAGHFHIYMERRVHHSIIKQTTCPLWQRIVNEAY